MNELNDNGRSETEELLTAGAIEVTNQQEFDSVIRKGGAVHNPLYCTGPLFSISEGQVFQKIVGNGVLTKINLVTSPGISFKISQINDSVKNVLYYLCTGEIITNAYIASQKPMELVFLSEEDFESWSGNHYDRNKIEVVILDDQFDELQNKTYGAEMTIVDVIDEFISEIF